MILVGRAGVGKDTVAEMFGDIPRYAYADAIKEMVTIIQSDGVNAGMQFISDLSSYSIEEIRDRKSTV